MTSRWLVLALTVLCAPACQNNARASLHSPAPPSDVATDAREAMARRDWGTAAPLFRRAIESAPDSLALHYGLAICATYLDLRDEAMREFQWVLARGTAGSEETTVARSWLQTSGPTANPADRSASERDGNDPKSGSGSVRGAVGWAEPSHSAQQPLNRKLLHLVGLKNTSTSGIRYSVRSDANGRYEFEHIVPGPYKLTDTIAGQPMWRLRITVRRLKTPSSISIPTTAPRSSTTFPSLARREAAYQKKLSAGRPSIRSLIRSRWTVSRNGDSHEAIPRHGDQRGPSLGVGLSGDGGGRTALVTVHFVQLLGR